MISVPLSFGQSTWRRISAIVPIGAATVSAMAAHRMIVDAHRQQDSIDSIVRGFAEMSLVGGYLLVAVAIVGVCVTGSLLFDSSPMGGFRATALWGSAVYLLGYLPWLTWRPREVVDQPSTHGQVMLFYLWLAGGLLLVFGMLWSTTPDFRRPHCREWYHSAWVPWALPACVFVAVTIGYAGGSLGLG